MKRVSFSVLLAAVLCLMGTKAQAYDFSQENTDGVTIYYNYINDATELEVVTGGNNSYSGDVAIPEEVTNKNITRKVTSIGSSAFSGCSGLTSVTIPSSVTSIGVSAFYNSSLTSVTIGSGVTSIGGYAFAYCSGLTSVQISDIESWCKIAFSDNFSNPLYYAHHLYLNGEEIKDLVIPNSVTTIGDYAFSGCSGLTSITIPCNVTSIGNRTFESCSGLTSITIPNSVTSIGEGTFSDCI